MQDDLTNVDINISFSDGGNNFLWFLHTFKVISAAKYAKAYYYLYSLVQILYFFKIVCVYNIIYIYLVKNLSIKIFFFKN